MFLEVSGDVTQTVSGTIEASGLALLVGGLATLDMGNDVDTLGVETEGELLYRDVDDVTVGSVSVDLGVSVIGGQLDLDGDGDIDVNDSGTVWGLVGSDTVNSEITVINGGLDVDGDNDVDGDDDGTVNGIAVAVRGARYGARRCASGAGDRYHEQRGRREADRGGCVE